MYCFICFVLDVFFGLTLIIPIAVIIQSSYILFELIIVYETLISESQKNNLSKSVKAGFLFFKNIILLIQLLIFQLTPLVLVGIIQNRKINTYKSLKLDWLLTRDKLAQYFVLPGVFRSKAYQRFRNVLNSWMV